LEADHAVGLLVARRQHQYRHARARPHRPADVEAVHPGQADVEHDEPHRVAVELDERVLAGANPDDAVAVALEVAADKLSDRGLVLDEQDRPRHLSANYARSVTRTRTAAPPSIRIVSAKSPRRRANGVTRKPRNMMIVSGESWTVTGTPPLSSRVSCVALACVIRPRSRIRVWSCFLIVTLISACDQLPGSFGKGGGWLRAPAAVTPA